VEEHYSNPHCFKEKNYEAKFSTSSIWKKIKSTKTILGKKQKNHKKKFMWGNTVAIYILQCFKEKKLQS
jgi:hypothetical protein